MQTQPVHAKHARYCEQANAEPRHWDARKAADNRKTGRRVIKGKRNPARPQAKPVPPPQIVVAAEISNAEILADMQHAEILRRLAFSRRKVPRCPDVTMQTVNGFHVTERLTADDVHGAIAQSAPASWGESRDG